MALLKKHQPHLVTNRCFPCLIAAWRQGIPLLSIHPSRPGTVAQQIRALVSVGLGQRHKSCHVTASRWWPKGTWPDLTAWGIFLRSGWYKQTMGWKIMKNQPPTICGMIMSLICMMVGCHLLSGMMMSLSHDGKIVICSMLFWASNNFTLLFASAIGRWCWGAMLRSFEIGKTWRIIPLSQWL